MGKLKDLSDQTFGRLKVIKDSGHVVKNRTIWKCRCACGKVKDVYVGNLVAGKIKSCGCLRDEMYKNGLFNKKHGQSKRGNETVEYGIFRHAKERAKTKGIPFNLEFPEDIIVPKVCPVFGIRLERGNNGKLKDSSPTLDRLIPDKGYIKGNVVIISYKANRMKNNGTLEDIKKLGLWLEKQIGLKQ